MNSPRRENFQIAFAVVCIAVLLSIGVIYVAIVYDPDVLAVLIPFPVIGLVWFLGYIGGKVYDRLNRD